MTFRVRIAPIAQQQMDAFAEYLGGYSEELAAEHFERLARILYVNLAEAPLAWGFLHKSNEPDS